MSVRTLCATATLLLLSGCATMARIEPIKGDGQALEYAKGTAFLFSSQGSTSVGISAAQASYVVTPRISFFIRVENFGQEPVDVSDANVRASGNGLPVAVISAERLSHEAQVQAQWAAVAVALAGAANQYNASQAGYTSYSGTGSANVYGSGGYARATGSYSGTAYDSGAAWQAQQQAAQQTASQLAAVEAQRQAQLSYIDSSVLQRTTVRPGEYVQGYVVVDAPKPRGPQNLVEILVAVAGDVHRFLFRETKLQ
jgi:hypothetical protein